MTIAMCSFTTSRVLFLHMWGYELHSGKTGPTVISQSRGVNDIMYLFYIPRTQMTPILKGQPPQTRPFPIKTGVIWVLGIYIYILC